MSNRKFKKGDIIKCIKELIDYSQIGDIPPKNKPVLGQDYEVLEDCLRYSVKLNINRAYYHPLEAFELVNDDKLSLVIAKLKEDLLDKNLTIKTNNEQRIMLKAICQELDIAHYTLVYSQYNNTVDIDNTYIVLYTTWTEGNPDTLFYGTNPQHDCVLINFEDLVAGFNQFKK